MGSPPADKDFMNHPNRKGNNFLSLFENIFINYINSLKEKRLEEQKTLFKKPFFGQDSFRWIQASEPFWRTTVTKKPNLPAVKAESPVAAISDDFYEHQGAGLQNVGASDVLIPRLSILQALSPQINKRKPEYIEGAEQGMICDIGTGELFKDGVLFVPCYYSKVYIEWHPRESDKGLAAIHTDSEILDQTTRNHRNQPVLPNGNYISETAQFFGLNLNADGRRSFIPMASTMLKRARRWMTLATGEKLDRGDGTKFTPPLFYRAYHLTTVADGNAQGDWFSWKIERGPSLPELGGAFKDLGFGNWRALKEDCVDFMKSLSEGKLRGDIGAPEESSQHDSEGAM